MKLHTFMAKRGSVMLPFFVLWLISLPGYAQMNISGKPGLIYIPTARETADGTFAIGYNYNPVKYGLRAREKSPERVLYATLAFTPRLDVNINLLQLIGTKDRPVREAIGDRQLDLRYTLLTETVKRPSVAIIVSSPFTVDAAMVTYAVVASKTLSINEQVLAEASAGLGSPYYIYRNESVNNNYNAFSKFRMRKKSEDRYKNNYLSGPFGGLSINYRKQAGLMAEWDSQRLNVGAYATLWKRWTLQVGLLNFDQVTFGTSYTVQLNALPRSLRKSDHD